MAAAGADRGREERGATEHREQRLNVAAEKNAQAVKGGGAWTRSSDFLQLPGGGLSEASGNWNASGWTVGGGLEWMFAPGWSVFGEYNYMDFGTRTVSFIAAPKRAGVISATCALQIAAPSTGQGKGR